MDNRKIIITKNEPFNAPKQDEEENKNHISSHPKFQNIIKNRNFRKKIILFKKKTSR